MLRKIKNIYHHIKNDFKEAGKIIDPRVYFEFSISLLFILGFTLFCFKQLDLFGRFGNFFSWTNYEDFENFFIDILIWQPLILSFMVVLYIVFSLLTWKVDFNQLDEKIKQEYPKGFVVYIVTGLLYAIITFLGFILLPFFTEMLNTNMYNNFKDIVLAMGVYLIIGGAVTQTALNKRKQRLQTNGVIPSKQTPQTKEVQNAKDNIHSSDSNI